MNCYVCSRSGKQEAANGICRYCGIALCAEHLADLQKHNQGGMHYPCNHRVAALTS